MLFIRTAIAYVLMLANAFLSAFNILLFLRRRPLMDRLAAQSRYAARNRAIMSVVCGLRCEIKDADQLPEPPYVILSKHQSSYEALVFASLFSPFVWVLKESLLRVPVLGPTLGSLAPIAIDRDRPRKALKQVLDQGTARLGAGISVLAFPEGTRFAPGMAGRYHVSGAMLAQRAGVAIVPVAHDAGTYWGAYSFPIRPGTIVVRIGATVRPEDTQGLSAAEIVDVVRERIETMMAEAREPINVVTTPETMDPASWPGPSAVHVWTAELNNVAEDAESVLPLLSSDERARAERLIAEDARDRFIVVHGLLRRVLAGYLGIAPEAVAIATGAQEKPALVDKTVNKDLVFNLAHSGMSAVIAVGAGSDIGVDVERLGRDRDAMAIARRYFSRAEYETLSQVPPEDIDRAFLTCWTRKEAVMKAHGGGMAVLGDIETGMEKAPEGRIIDIEGRRFTVRDLDGPKDCIGAVARAGGDFDVVQRVVG